MVIVYGIVNVDGELEGLSVKQSPHLLLNAPILSALEEWSFRPAQLNGEAVPVKILLGIPLALPD